MSERDQLIKVQIKRFDDLTPKQVANLYALRYNVFVKEQKSIFDEHDGKDFEAIHIFVEKDNSIIAYARAFKVGEHSATFGRVAVHPDYRKQGLGKQIVRQTLSAIKEMKNITEVNIEAQEYLKKFYEGFGFQTTSEPFDDEGVMHVAMSLKLNFF